MRQNKKTYKVDGQLAKSVADFINNQVPGLEIKESHAIEVALKQMLGREIDIKILKNNKYKIKTK